MILSIRAVFNPKTTVQTLQTGQSQSRFLPGADLLPGRIIFGGGWEKGKWGGGGGGGRSRMRLVDYDYSISYGVSMRYGQ